MRDQKLTDQIAGVENTGLEIGGLTSIPSDATTLWLICHTGKFHLLYDYFPFVEFVQDKYFKQVYRRRYESRRSSKLKLH